MSEKEIMNIVDSATIIVNGYAFTKKDDGMIDILNIDHPDCAMVINREGEMIETNMDPIEQSIVLELCKKNLQFMED